MWITSPKVVQGARQNYVHEVRHRWEPDEVATKILRAAEIVELELAELEL